MTLKIEIDNKKAKPKTPNSN